MINYCSNYKPSLHVGVIKLNQFPVSFWIVLYFRASFSKFGQPIAIKRRIGRGDEEMKIVFKKMQKDSLIIVA